MRILIFENEFVYLDTAFRYVNKLYFNNNLVFEVFANSQDLRPFSSVMNYHSIIVDISLSKKSLLDGYGILKKLVELNYDESKILIMTGNHQIKESLVEKGLHSNYQIVTKPIDIYDLKKALEKII